MLENIKEKLQNRLGKDRSNLLGHSKNYFYGNMAVKALGFISVPIFTRLLTPEDYGIVNVVTSLTQIFIVLMMLNVQGSISRYYFEEQNDYPKFVGNIISFLFVFNAVIMSFVVIFKKPLSTFFAVNQTLLIIALLIAFLKIAVELFNAYLQASKQSKLFAKIAFANNFLIIPISIVFILLLDNEKYLGKLYAMLIVSASFGIYAGYKLIKLSKFQFDISMVKYALVFGIPLIPHALSSFILAHFDRVMVNQISGANDAGLYSFAYNIGMIMNVVVISINKAWIPVFYQKIRESKYAEIERLVQDNTKIVSIIGLALMLFSKELVMIMAGSEYIEALELVPIIVLSYIVVHLYTTFVNYSFFRKKTFLISLSTLMAGVINIILNYQFIPEYGYIAAAYTTLISYLILLVLHFINSKWILKEKTISLFKLLKPIIGLVGLYFVFNIIEQGVSDIVILFFVKLILLAVYIAISLNLVRRFLNND